MNPASSVPADIPLLALSQQLYPVPERIAVALDARATEKALISQLVAQWLQALEPEMERMARDIVQKSAQAYWREHVAGRNRR